MTAAGAPVQLREYGDPVEVDLDADELLELEEAAQHWQSRLRLQRPPFVVHRRRGGRATVEARDVTGVVRIGRIDLEVSPKFLDGAGGDDWRAALLNVLSVLGRGLDEAQPTSIDASRSPSMADLFAHVMVRALDASVAVGLPRAYEERRELVPYVRGRIDLTAVLPLALRRDVLPCVFDELTVDNDTNRLLRWALATLAPDVRTSSLRTQVEHWTAELRDVQRLGAAGTGPALPPLGLQHQMLRPAVRVAELLRSGRGARHSEGAEDAPGFLWRSSSVFESFSSLLLQRYCRSRPGLVFSQDAMVMATPTVAADLPPGFLAGGRDLLSEPDHRLRRAGQDVLLLDAKYKSWSGGPRSADTYQVLAGGRLGDCQDVALVYPSPGGGRRRPYCWTVAAPGVPARVSAVFLDVLLMAQPFGLRALDRDLAEDLDPLVP